MFFLIIGYVVQEGKAWEGSDCLAVSTPDIDLLVHQLCH